MGRNLQKVHYKMQAIHNSDTYVTQCAILTIDLLLFSNAVLIKSTGDGPGQSWSHLTPHRPLASVIYKRIPLVNLGDPRESADLHRVGA